MLEIGAGTGRVTVALAQQGIHVAGVEPSEAMLDRARRRAAAQPEAARRITWHQAEAAAFSTGGRFHLAIVPFGTFSHLLQPEDQLAALRRVAAHLHPGAGLAIDLGNPLAALRADDIPVMTHERTFEDPQTGSAVMQQSLKTIDRTTQIETVTWVYDRVEPDGCLHRSVVPMELRHTLAPEMRLLLALAGYRDVEFYGDYDFSPYTEDSPRLFTVASRGEADL